MKFWQVLSFAEVDQLVDLARAAEEAGFDGVFVSDHLFFPARIESKYPYGDGSHPDFDGRTPFPEPWALLSAMAAATTRLQLGTMVYILPLRHPVEAAKAVATAATLSGGRVALGAGAGWMREEFDALGVDFSTRGRRFDEMIEVVRKLWSGDMVEHRGRIFDLPPMQMSPAPPAPVPIWIGGCSDAALRRAARLGDGWIGTGHAPDELPQLLGRLRAQREKAGRAQLHFETIVPLTVPPEPDLLRRLEAEHGVTATTAWPFLYTLGPTSTLAQKRDAMLRYADEVIAKLR